MTFTDHNVPEAGEIPRQHRQRPDSHVLALVGYEPRDGENDRLVANTPAPPQRACIVSGTEACGVGAEIESSDWRRGLDANFFHHI
jgi:hypothetical protein